MSDQTKVPTGFRKILRGELPAWQAEGLLTPSQAESLTGKYDLAGLPAESANIFLIAICVLGAALIGGGVISFVAYHWDGIGRWTKVALLISALGGVEFAGFYLRDVSGKMPVLGHGLLAAGALIFGANIGLIVQIFHIQSHYHGAFGGWAVATLVLAWTMRSWLVAVVSVVASFIWFTGWIDFNEGAFNYYPLVLIAGFATLAYQQRSAFLFALVTLALAISACIYAGINGDTSWPSIAMALCVGQMLAGWGILTRHSSRFSEFKTLATVSVTVGIATLVLATYLLSFHDFAEKIHNDFWNIKSWMWAWTAFPALLAGVVMWVFSAGRGWAAKDYRPVLIATWLTCVVLAATLYFPLIGPGSVLVQVVLANIALVGMAAGLTWAGTKILDRRLLWLGVILAALILASRFLEYETNLMAKSAVFLLCGAAVLIVGVKFETHLKNVRSTHEQA